MRSHWGVIAIAVLTHASVALADPNDFRIYQLGNPATSSAANANFRAFLRELGAAVTSANLMPPETLGHAAFSITAELSIVDLKARDAAGGPCNVDPDGCFLFPNERLLGSGVGFSGPLFVPSVHIRKGLPFSLELGTRIGWIDQSRMAVVTGEVKWALNEGFLYLPDVGVRLHGTRILNTRDFELTAGGLDVGVGKQFAVGGMITLTPYVGWNLVWVGGGSETVDFRPERSASDATSTRIAQLMDTGVYEPLSFFQNGHNRFYGGLRFIGGVVQLGVEVSLSALGRFQDADSGAERTMPSVVAFNTTLGLDF